MQYDKEFKLQALELSDEIGVKAAADQLGIKYYTLADWRRQRKARGKEAFVGSGNKMMPLSEKDRRIKELEAELRETRRANDILKEALGFSHKAERSESSKTF
jgi:transposase